jgi:predicted porin
MKKSLFALAAMSAFAGAVQAQSSVTVYGIVDESVVSSQTKATNGVKATNDSIASGIASTSRLGFRGVEDLGGGLTASFTAEAGMNAASSSSGGLLSTSATSGNRQTFVRLDKKGMGAVYGGYHVTDTHSARATNDPFGGINLPGNPIVGVSLGNIAASSTISNNLYPVIGTASAAVVGGTATNNDYILRAPMIGFTTAPIAGVTLTYQRAQANAVSTTAANVETPTRSNGNTFGARYTLGKLNVLAAYNDTVNQTLITGTNNNRKVQNTTIGANYDFGVARIYATYSNDQMKFDDATLANNNDVKNTNTQVAVQAPIGAVTLRAGYTTGKYTLGRSQAASGGLGGARDTSGYQAGVFYGLSKRTDIYAAYGSQSRKVISTLVDATDTAYAVGVRHTF